MIADLLDLFVICLILYVLGGFLGTVIGHYTKRIDDALHTRSMNRKQLKEQSK